MWRKVGAPVSLGDPRSSCWGSKGTAATEEGARSLASELDLQYYLPASQRLNSKRAFGSGGGSGYPVHQWVVLSRPRVTQWQLSSNSL